MQSSTLRTLFNPSRTRIPVSSRLFQSPLLLTHLRTVTGGPTGAQPFKVWPFIFILALGSGTYVYMVKSSVGTENNTPRTRPRNPPSGPIPNSQSRLP